MWTPDPTWQRLAARGDAARVWRRSIPGRGVWVGKRLVRPLHDVDAAYAGRADLDPGHVLWWRREADLVEQRWAEGLPGLRGPSGGMVEEDADGLTLCWPLLERPPAGESQIAAALGRLATGPIPDQPWSCTDQLGDRWRAVAASGGWSTIGSTPAAEVAAAIWEARTQLLEASAALPRTPTHGDVTPGNLLGEAAGAGAPSVVACDWSAAGSGPVGADLGFFTLSTRSSLSPLVEVYGAAASAAGRTLAPGDIALGARIQMAFTVITRVDRTLGRVADGEGDWSSKLRHPAVTPVMRALQRAYADFRPLLDLV